MVSKMVNELNLLNISMQTNIIMDLCADSYKSKVITFMVKSLSMNPTFKTKEHIRVAMEFISSSFLLPISDDALQVMEIAHGIYRKWLGLAVTESSRVVVPDCFSDNIQYYYQEIFIHLAFLFERRPLSSKSNTEKYLGLCREVLRTFNSIGVELNSKLSEETWSSLLKVHLLIAHCFLKQPRDLADPMEQLTTILVENLFELWLHSASQDTSLFSHLANFVSQWTHREIVLIRWFAVCDALTKRMLNLLYDVPYPYIPHIIRASPAQNEALLKREQALTNLQHNYLIVLFPNSKEMVRAKMFRVADDQIIFLWISFWTIFERSQAQTNEKMFADPEIFKLYLKYASALFKDISRVGSFITRPKQDVHFDQNEIEKLSKEKIEPRVPQSESFKPELATLINAIKGERVKHGYTLPSIPNGTVVIQTIGLKILNAICRFAKQPEYRQLAVTELCQIFSRFPGQYPLYCIAWFYNWIKSIIDTENINLHVSQNILIKSKLLFTSDLPGIHVLFPYFANYIILRLKSTKIFNDDKFLRNSLLIISQLAAICPNYFASITDVVKEESKFSSVMSLMNRYVETQKLLGQFVEMTMKQFKFVNDKL